MDFNSAEPKYYGTYFPLHQFQLSKWSFFIHSTTRNAPDIHRRLHLILYLCWAFQIAIAVEAFKVVRDPCQKITLLLLKSKSVRVIVPESCF